MRELLEYLVKALVTNPEAVEVFKETNELGEVVLKLKVAEEDMGRVIGKQGKIIKALRQVVRVAAVKENQRVQVELMETSGGPSSSQTLEEEKEATSGKKAKARKEGGDEEEKA